MSVEEEFNSLVDGLDVRILSSWKDDCKRGNVDRFVLEPGDLLYLPPRVAHCGVALTNSCMTLSVGCRAPSATDMISRLAEMMTNSLSSKAAERIRDDDLLEVGILGNSGEITELAKGRARKLVRSAVEEYLDDDDKWDEIFGQLVTGSPQRQRMNYPAPLIDGDEDDLGVWGNAKTAVSAMLQGNGALYQAEGIGFGYSLLSGKKEKEKSYRLFINGEFWDVSCTTNEEEVASLLRILTSQRRLDRDVLAEGAMKQEQKCLPSDLVALLEDLVGKGYLYGSDE
jgi:50S ribosomal protein L16 3-hydroxylase